MKKIEIKIEPVCQYPEFPTGCEATSLAMFLDFISSKKFDKSDFRKFPQGKQGIAKVVDLLAKESSPSFPDHPSLKLLCDRIFSKKKQQNQEKFENLRFLGIGGDPNRAFVGCARDAILGYGVFAHPIFLALKAALNENKLDQEFEPIDLTGRSIEDIENWLQGIEGDDRENKKEKDQQAIVERPVIAWISLELKPIRPTEVWLDQKAFEEEAKRALDHELSEPELEEICNRIPCLIWKSPEHCVLLLKSEDGSLVQIADPHTGKIEDLDRTLFFDRWKELGSMAVSISKKTK